VRRAAALWIVFLGLYLCFAAPVSSSELVAGVPIAAALTAFALLYRRAEERRMNLLAPWLRVIFRSLGSVPGDVLRVGRMLIGSLWHAPERQVGIASHQPFRQGDDDRAAGLHDRGGRLRHVEGSMDVGGEHRLPILIARLLQRGRWRLIGRVVDQDIELAEGLDRLLDERARLG
jgi:hypothetical protein